MMTLRPPLRLMTLLCGTAFVLGGSLWVRSPGGADPSVGPARYAEHPPLAHTGGFGEPTCHACHFGGEVNGGEGELTVEHLPDTVRPGQAVVLTVTLAAAMERAGFMLAVRRSDGRQAGRLVAVDTTRTAVSTVDSTGVQYAHHTLAGTALPTPNRTQWHVRWTAPGRAADTIRVHVAANAANDDASEFGDDIYATQQRVLVE